VPSDSPPPADLRGGKGVQVGSGINIQFNEYHGGAPYPSRKVARLPAARPVTAWEPFELGIRPVLAVPGHAGASVGLPEIPPYIAREHDVEIDAHLTGIASRMIVASGSSCTGKSRALYEALLRHEEIQGWGLQYPAGPEQLLELLIDGQLSPQTVLWLTDLDQFLLAPMGESIAEALRDLLREPSMAPVTVVATLWPGHWDDLTQEPEDNFPAPYPQARQLLVQQSRRVRIPEKFSKASLHSLASAADPRLAEAASLAGDGGEVIQALAGGPYLLDKYLLTGQESQKIAFPRAVILVAIDARRLRLAPELSRMFLEQAAHGYLIPEVRLDAPADWPGRGLRDVTRKQRGVRALSPVRWDTDRTGPADAYRLHDFLAQHGTRLRAEELIPASFWEAASGTAGLAGPAYLMLAREAHQRFLYAYAQRYYRLAAGAGVPDANEGLLALLREQGRDDLIQAELDLVRARAARGDLAAHRLIVNVLNQASRRPGKLLSAALRAAYEDAVHAGCEDLREDLADALMADGADEDAIREFRRILDLNPDAGYARLRLISLFIRQGETREATELAYAAPAEGSRASLSELVGAGLADQALSIVRSAVDTGQLPASASDLGLAEKLTSGAGGIELLRLMAAYGSLPAELAYRRITAQRADDDELSQRDDEEALEERARRLAEAGREGELRRLADGDDRAARWHLTLLLEKEGRIAEAIEVLRPQAYAAAATGLGALALEPAYLVRLLEKSGQHDALHELVLSDRLAYGRPLAGWAYRHKRRADLEHLARYTGDKYVRRRLAWLLRDNGDDAALEELATRSGAAYRELIDSLACRGETQQLYRRVLLGEEYAQRTLRHLIENYDQRIPADALRSNGLTPSGTLAE
jgi:hypothetical protein